MRKEGSGEKKGFVIVNCSQKHYQPGIKISKPTFNVQINNNGLVEAGKFDAAQFAQALQAAA